jgi:hypothetical protein
MSGLKEPELVKVVIDQDCEMCSRFGAKLSAGGISVAGRAARKDGSIEVELSDGATLNGYPAMLAIALKRGKISRGLRDILLSPVPATIGALGYRLIANNRKLLSRILFRS